MRVLASLRLETGSFQIEEREGRYSLVFYEPKFTGKPWDYVDPVVIDSSLNECVGKLIEIVKQELSGKTGE